MNKNENYSEIYNEQFYSLNIEGSYRSACVYAERLFSFLLPQSIVDLGCGRGTWLKAFKDTGKLDNDSCELVGYDGPWNSQEKMIDSSIKFNSIDLNSKISNIPLTKKFDLAISVEVAEHVYPSSSKTFIQNLIDFSDVVLFSAAFTMQGGDNHINEQHHSYWAKIFSDFGYAPYDFFRPFFWDNPLIEPWYRQNVFLYVKKDCFFDKILKKEGYYPIQNVQFMDCMHPDIYESRIIQLQKEIDPNRKNKLKKYRQISKFLSFIVISLIIYVFMINLL